MVLLILAAVSGTGKSTVGHALRERCPNLKLSVSHTTRSPRPGEVDGVHYHFESREAFERRIEDGDFVEWAEYAGNLYGTSRSTIAKADAAGLDLLFDVEVVGAAQLKRAYGVQARSVFLLPPSWAELERRLRARKTDTEAAILRRLATGRTELEAARSFDYLVTNAELDGCVRLVETIYTAARSATGGNVGLLDAIEAEMDAARSPVTDD